VADACVDYPLPPNEEKTEILRVVVRESLSLDMIDRLVADICGVTEMLMNTDAVDLAAFQPGLAPSIEKQHANKGLRKEHKHKAQRPTTDGVYRTVC
jgi:glutamate decarboxylase